ncbi:MAG: 4'-phosphopantetheinyl transferase superfamily protein [Bacteroidetes bacterium]|nr:4'-phosphopantetheinyl transferase superfamily protein [Bacteroidota bacterium]
MGLVELRKERDETKVGIWKMEETIDQLKKSLILNAAEIRYFSTLNKGKRNMHWVAGRVLLRHVLETDHFIKVEGDIHGKPQLLNFDFEMSISHSADYAAVAISKKKVGIDIEEIKPVIKKICSKFMSEKEISEVPIGEHEIEQLYVYWCTKESIFKLNGKKQLHFREHIHIDGFAYKGEGYIKAHIKQNDFEQSFDVRYEKYDGYMLTYVIDE